MYPFKKIITAKKQIEYEVTEIPPLVTKKKSWLLKILDVGLVFKKLWLIFLCKTITTQFQNITQKMYQSYTKESQLEYFVQYNLQPHDHKF